VQAFTRESLSVFDAEKGGKFVLFNGNVSGEFTELVSPGIILFHVLSPVYLYTSITVLSYGPSMIPELHVCEVSSILRCSPCR
jgi:hypothetical protein